ncbi:MAG: hypothetical protein ACRDTD_21660, partial [Pseudonocardiaceae bacterium]
RSKKLQRRYAQFQLERGGSMLAVGERFLADGATGSTVAAALEAAGDEALRQRPDLAEKLFAAAGAAGGVHRLSARQAHAAALAGDTATALRLAEEVLANPAPASDRQRAVLVAAALLAQRGVAGRSTQLYTDELGVTALAAPLLIGAGEVGRARELLTEPVPPDVTAPSVTEVGRCVAAALLAGLDAGHTDALALLNTAITLSEPIGETLMLPQTPAALCAIVATQRGEFEVAEAALRRAVAGKLGGRLAHPRHLLLHGWVSMLTGNLSSAHRALDRVSAAPGETAAAQPKRELQPGDELLAEHRRNTGHPGGSVRWRRGGGFGYGGARISRTVEQCRHETKGPLQQTTAENHSRTSW